jgi:hypothetical protein
LSFPDSYPSLHFLHYLCFHTLSEDACESEGRVPTPVTKALEGSPHSVCIRAELHIIPERKQVV